MVVDDVGHRPDATHELGSDRAKDNHPQNQQPEEPENQPRCGLCAPEANGYGQQLDDQKGNADAATGAVRGRPDARHRLTRALLTARPVLEFRVTHRVSTTPRNFRDAGRVDPLAPRWPAPLPSGTGSQCPRRRGSLRRR